ncbi:hypothetical protein Cgig2_017514 [Carnegiea gigantea]|uniref:Uncharacterized protein n=1 Tax=Carnegiea gigantea TaxID=171969 RepID=A0A9Q1K2P3_9CARY|nr:hypothetical protein Cgig2_017514 [Carnegiea gigantea]
MKRSFSESMERVGQLTGNNIRRLFKKEKLNCKRNRHTWHQKTECIPNLWHHPMALRQPLRNHLQRVAVIENLQYKDLLIQLSEKRCKDRWFPATIHWTTDAVKQRNKEEKEFRGEHRRVLYLDRVELIGKRCKDQRFPTAIHWTTDVVPKQPSVACGNEREPLIVPDDPIEEDIYAAFVLAVGPLEVQPTLTCEPITEHSNPIKQQRTRIGTTKVRKMVEKILERGDHGEEFQRDFVLHIISTSIPYIFGGIEFQEKRCKDRWLLTTMHWIADAVKQTNKDEKDFRRDHRRVKQRNKDEKDCPGEHGKGRTINREEYQQIIHEREIEL